MTHPVDRLKELLFDEEARALSDVQQRLAQSESRSEAARRDFADRLDAVFNRAGSDERFSAAVASVLDGALRTAEVERHRQLSDAVAPLIVRTIKTEITNSRDELVDALYPITGRMVKAYVASAVADLMAQINRRVEGNPVMLRVRSLMSGKTVAELAFADANRPQVTELYLIRRGSGELIGRWPHVEGNERDHVMSGVLAAINEFASEAFRGAGSELRQIDMGDARVYLRGSPVYLLAARCTGSAPLAAERLIDSAVLTTIEACHGVAASGPQGQGPLAATPYLAQLSRMSDGLNAELAESSLHDGRSRGSPAVVLLGILGLVLAGLLGWYVLERTYTTRATSAAKVVIEGNGAVKGYPIEVHVDGWARNVTLTGLVPDDAAKAALVEQLRGRVPGSRVRDALNVLPGAHGEIGNAIERASVTDALSRAAQRLAQTRSDLSLLSAMVDKQDAVIVDRSSQAVNVALRDLADRNGTLYSKAAVQGELCVKLSAAADELSGMGLQVAPDQRRKPAAAAKPATTVEGARLLATAADRLADVTTGVLQAVALKRRLPQPEPAIVRAPDITAFERLSVFVRSHAIFFGDDVTYRDEGRTAGTLDALAKLMSETDAYLRVVGYTDTKGAAARNDTLSAQRAEKVARDLRSRGVPAERIIAIGRQDANQITQQIGETSSNRRVEFEIGFDGERGG
jgi:outer membrane protein OmpA-like peptidoglycan-associated protein